MKLAERPMRICIDARVFAGATYGGVGQVTLGLARGLSSLEGADRYLFLVTRDLIEWLAPYVTGPCELSVVAAPSMTRIRRLAKSSLARSAFEAPARRLRDAARATRSPKVPRSDGTLEGMGCDLVHFIHSEAVITELPSIYHPHDLQHLHLPQFFSTWQLKHRAVLYRTLCEQARAVAVTSSWIADDIHRQLGIPPSKIAVVPFAPPTSAYDAPDAGLLTRMRQRVGFERFVFYPAQTWPHKNHLKLFEALRLLRDRNVIVPLVCTGHQTDFFATLSAQLEILGLGDQVRFLGHVSEAEIKCLYELCAFVVVPTKFEAVSAPIWEAFAAGRAVAASTVTSLPQQVGDSGLLFDPDDVPQMALCIDRLWHDDELRRELIRRGLERVRVFTWERTARHFRALYRRLLGRTLDVEDAAILAAPPLI